MQILCRRHSGHGTEGQLQQALPRSAGMSPAPFLFQGVGCHESLVGTDYTTLWAHPSAQCFPSMPRTGSCNMGRHTAKMFPSLYLFLVPRKVPLVQKTGNFKEGMNQGWWAAVGRQWSMSCPLCQRLTTHLHFFTSVQLPV